MHKIAHYPSEPFPDRIEFDTGDHSRIMASLYWSQACRIARSVFGVDDTVWIKDSWNLTIAFRSQQELTWFLLRHQS